MQKDSNCCATCKVCDSSALMACTTTGLPTCTVGQKMYLTNAGTTACCPQCMPGTSYVKPADTKCPVASSLPFCAAGKVSSQDSNGCNTCAQSDGRSSGCSTSSILSGCTAAAINALPVCQPKTMPTRDSTTCCMTCKIQLNATGSLLKDIANIDFTKAGADVASLLKTANKCSEKAMQTQCQALQKASAIPVCDVANKQVPSFNASSCCVDCRLPTPAASVDRPESDGSCSRKGYANCMQNRTACATGEVPMRLEGQCCPSCVRAETLCSLDAVIKCVNTTRLCATGEVPSVASGECCPTCRFAKKSSEGEGLNLASFDKTKVSSLLAYTANKEGASVPTTTFDIPTCSPACEGSYYCLRKKAGNSWSASCVQSQQCTIFLNSRTESTRAALKNYTAVEMRELLNEAVSRYCETEAAPACALFQQRGDLEAVVGKPFVDTASGSTGVVITTPKTPITAADAGTAARLLGASTSLSYSEVVSSSVAEGDLNGVVTTQDNSGAAPGSTSGAVQLQVSSVVAAVAAVLAVVAARV